MINIEQIKQKILEFLKQKGPSLPVPIAKHIELSPTFTSAILSELTDAKQVKISNLKVGSSPLYFLPGQEPQLENFLDNIEGVKKTALLKLKQNKILYDEKQDPAIRVALRSIRDFATPLNFQGKLIWKYFTITNEEVQRLIQNIQKGIRLPAIKHEKGERFALDEIEIKSKSKSRIGTSERSERDLGGHQPQTTKPKEKPLLEIKTLKQKTPTKPNKFLEQVKSFLLEKDIEFLKQISIDKKEITGIARINSDLGKISLFLVAKDKKRISEEDITVALQKAQHEKMSCLILSHGEPGKKIQAWLEDYKNIIKVLKIK